VNSAVIFEDVTKRYLRGGPRYASIRHEILDGLRGLTRHLGRPAEPHGTIALEDVSFEVRQGESFALIGSNGAGKSTALKLIARISYPTGGRVRVRGRVAALIEVGSGVHPELTARENIWLYGQIMGMSKADIRRRFDQIVDFADIGSALETAVKMYSSGMQLRLGFAIASHLDPEIFVVDEALAVGDASFQAKCIERMTKLVTEGRTLLFVSHALPAVSQVCRRALLLECGRAVTEGPAAEVVRSYIERVSQSARWDAAEGEVIEVRGLKVAAPGRPRRRIATNDALRIAIDLEVETGLADAVIGIALTDGRPGNLINWTMLSTNESVALTAGLHRVCCEVSSLPLLPGAYELWATVTSATRLHHYLDPRVVGTIVVTDGPTGRAFDARFVTSQGFGPVHVPFSMTVKPVSAVAAEEHAQ
jgi:ABC-type polysaccharide/polyol phosphate transport system ATPase subunit